MMQLGGDNVLALLQSIAHAKEFKFNVDPASTEEQSMLCWLQLSRKILSASSVVYFDIAHRWMFLYDKKHAPVLAMFLFEIALAFSYDKLNLRPIGALLVSIVAGVGAPLAVAKAIVVLGWSMNWFANPSLLYGLFMTVPVCPCVSLTST